MESKDIATTAGENKELQIDSNQINVSNRKNQQFYVYLSKKILEKHDELILHALGNATTTSVIAAESLVRNGYADYVKMETKTIDVEESRKNKNSSAKPEESRTVKRAKLIVTLKKSANFDENMKKSAEIKEENEKYIEAERQVREAKAANKPKAETAKE